MASQTGIDVRYAADLLRQGQLVAIPTETVYGLAANALDIIAVARIFAAKNRPHFDPLIIHGQSLHALAPYVQDVPEQAHMLANMVWPGPLTLLLPRTHRVPDLVTAGSDRVAVRVPDHPLTLALLAQLDFPLAAPSANPFGYISPTTAAHVAAQLGNKVGYILDGGAADVGVESTIVGWEDGQATVYRLGGLPLELLRDVLGTVDVRTSSSNPLAPGMLASHYAPRTPVKAANRETWLATPPTDGVGALVWRQPLPGIPLSKQRVLSVAGDDTEAAANLFAYLRELDALDLTEIWAEWAPETGLGRAINDRLRRAAVAR